MRRVLEQVLHQHVVALQKVGITSLHVEAPDNSPYEWANALREYQITIRTTNVACEIRNFTLKLSDLPGCCGVLEFNRPSYLQGDLPQFTLLMDCLLETLHKLSYPGLNSYNIRWGNQIIATTSLESSTLWVAYLKKHHWQHFTASRNPRTGNLCTIWRKVV